MVFHILFRSKPTSGSHVDAGYEEHWGYAFAKETDGYEGSDEGGYGIVGACLGGSDGALGIGVATDAEAVGHEAEEKEDDVAQQHVPTSQCWQARQ